MRYHIEAHEKPSQIVCNTMKQPNNLRSVPCPTLRRHVTCHRNDIKLEGSSNFEYMAKLQVCSVFQFQESEVADVANNRDAVATAKLLRIEITIGLHISCSFLFGEIFLHPR